MPSILKLLALYVCFIGLISSGQKTKAHAAQTDLLTACKQALEKCSYSCRDDLPCEIRCTNEYDSCKRRQFAADSLAPAGLYANVATGGATNKDAVEDDCSQCLASCGGVEIPSCFFECKSICESPNALQRTKDELLMNQKI